MDLCGVKVKHACFGQGTIASLENGRVRVLFDTACGEKLFVYPDVFKGFLTALDEGANAQIIQDLAAKNEAEKRSAAQRMERMQAFREQVAAEKTASRSVRSKLTADKK